jgi:hypothetical protein
MIELIVDNEVVKVPNEINIGMYRQINLNQVNYSYRISWYYLMVQSW